MTQFEKELLQRIEELEKEKSKLEGIEDNKTPIYKYSKIRDVDLEKLVDIERNLDKNIFDSWLNNKIKLSESTELFLQKLIDDNEDLILSYKEEDLKMKFIGPLLNEVNFKSYENKFREFYEEKLKYETENFIFTGTIDFVVSKGLVKSKKPYFFIQEFKRNEEYSNPRPQLLAELISAVELNNWQTIKGAYIVGAHWNFVILNKLDKHKYEYFISQNFDSSKINDLKDIFRNLLFIKEEVTQMIMDGVWL